MKKFFVFAALILALAVIGGCSEFQPMKNTSPVETSR